MKNRRLPVIYVLIMALMMITVQFQTNDVKALNSFPIRMGKKDLQPGENHIFGGTVTYEPQNNSVIIKNVKMDDQSNGLYVSSNITDVNNDDPIKIYLKGENYFGTEDKPLGFTKSGIYASRSIEIIADDDAKLICYIGGRGGIGIYGGPDVNVSVTGGTYVFHDLSKNDTDIFNVASGLIDIDHADITMDSVNNNMNGAGISINHSSITASSTSNGIYSKSYVHLLNSTLNMKNKYVNCWAADGNMMIQNTTFTGESTDDLGLYSQSGSILISNASNIDLTSGLNSGIRAAGNVSIDNSAISIEALKGNSILSKLLNVAGENTTIQAASKKAMQADNIFVHSCKLLKSSVTTDSALKGNEITISGGTIEAITTSTENNAAGTSAIYAEKNIVLEGINTNVKAQAKQQYGIFSNGGTISLLARSIEAIGGSNYPAIVARESSADAGAAHSKNIIIGENYTVGNNLVVSTIWQASGSNWYADSFLAPAGTAAEVNDYSQSITVLDAGMLADYAEIDAIIKRIPATKDLKMYTDESVTALLNKKDSLIRGKRIDFQDELDQFADDLQILLDALEYKPADFSKIDAILKKAGDLSGYTNESRAKFLALMNRLDRSMNITQQKQVDELAKSLEKAYADLIKIKDNLDPSDTGGLQNNKRPDTSDHTQRIIWIIMLVISAACMLGIQKKQHVMRYHDES